MTAIKRTSLMICILIIVTMMVLNLSDASQRVTKTSSQTEWLLLRSQANEDPNTTIGSATITIATAGDYDSMPTDANGIIKLQAEHDSGDIPGSTGNFSTDAYAVEIIACAGPADGNTFTVNLYAWEKWNGPAGHICTIEYTTGTMEVVKYLAADSDNSITAGDTATNIYWADTANITSYWYDNKIMTANTAGNNEMARIMVILYGQAYIYAVVSSADGSTGTEAGNVTLYYRKVSG